ncbi:MAG TPA: hypothetical protein VGF98_02385 [Candidatus Tumulicola sp.]|jgi:hypothetical protein
MESDLPTQFPDTPDEIDENGDDRDALDDEGDDGDPVSDERIH